MHDITKSGFGQNKGKHGTKIQGQSNDGLAVWT